MMPNLPNLLPASLLLVLALSISGVEAAEAKLANERLRLFEQLDQNGDGQLAAQEVASDQQRLYRRLVRIADANGDGVLSADEFCDGLSTRRPQKAATDSEEEYQPEEDALRFVLLSMDTNRNAWIEADEVPARLSGVFARIVDEFDRNANEVLETLELARAGRRLSQIATRYVAREQINVQQQLRRLRREQGREFSRFDRQRTLLELLADAGQSRSLFERLDRNQDGFVEQGEFPEQLQNPSRRFLRLADQNRDRKLTLDEFQTGARRAAERSR